MQRLSKSKPQPVNAEPSASDLQRWIAEAAYYRAESRGFEPGGETQDWLAAEAEILARGDRQARTTNGKIGNDG